MADASASERVLPIRANLLELYDTATMSLHTAADLVRESKSPEDNSVCELAAVLHQQLFRWDQIPPQAREEWIAFTKRPHEKTALEEAVQFALGVWRCLWSEKRVRPVLRSKGMTAGEAEELKAAWPTVAKRLRLMAIPDQPRVDDGLVRELTDMRVIVRSPDAAAAALVVSRSRAGRTDASNERVDGASRLASLDPERERSPMAPRDIATYFGLDLGKLDGRLKRWRLKNADQSGKGWLEVNDRRSKEAKYLYCICAVRAIIQDLCARQSADEKKSR